VILFGHRRDHFSPTRPQAASQLVAIHRSGWRSRLRRDVGYQSLFCNELGMTHDAHDAFSF
jgi:hypothetical protein